MERADTSSDVLEAHLAGRYRIERRLGRGGMATVYLAEDLKHRRKVAIKVIRPELSASVSASRFAREIDVAARLQHPHIVPLFDSGTADGLLYFIMAYEEGESLQDCIGRLKQLPVEQALRITSEVADALEYAHARGIVHRDVKPANILLASGHALLADFGIARALAPDDDQVTTTGHVVGTPAYMSPEQGLAEREIDGRSDVYSLGCVLFEMLSGTPPFRASTLQSVLASHLASTPPSVRVLRPALAGCVEEIIRRSLAKLPADRYQSAAELRDAVVRCAAESSTSGERARHPTPSGTGSDVGGTARAPSWRRYALAASLVAIGMAAWRFSTWSTAPALDVRRVVIFPLVARASVTARTGSDAGESAARLLGYALEGSAEMRWLDAGDYRPGDGRGAPSLVEQMELARSLGAAYFIDGSLEPRGDSLLTVILRLHSVEGDSLVARRGAEGSWEPDAVPQLALQAMRALLPALLEPGGSVDMGAFADRKPAAIATFLRAEQAYREGRLDDALRGYSAAVDGDSALAVAALKGAQTASWLDRSAEAGQLIDAALRYVSLLPPRYAVYARALHSYLVGDADDALAVTRRLVESEPRWSDAWFLLGETNFHLLPSMQGDSLEILADSAFRMTGRADTAFWPATSHLHELALRHGDLALADSLAPIVRRTLPDSSARWLEAMQRCVRSGVASVNWASLADAGVRGGYDWGYSLLFDPARGACARAAFAIPLASPHATVSARWGAVVGTHGSLIAAGRDREAAAFVKSPVARGLPGGALLVPAATAGADVAAEASEAVKELGDDLQSMSGPRLWLLTTWRSAHGDSSELRRIRDVLASRLQRSPHRLDSLFTAIAEAHLAAARGDTSATIGQLRKLSPRAPYNELAYQPWEALASERLLLAQLLERTGARAEAIAVASTFDAPNAIVHLSYIRASLQLRERIARGSADSAAAVLYRNRLARLSADRAPYP